MIQPAGLQCHACDGGVAGVAAGLSETTAESGAVVPIASGRGRVRSLGCNSADEFLLLGMAPSSGLEGLGVSLGCIVVRGGGGNVD